MAKFKVLFLNVPQFKVPFERTSIQGTQTSTIYIKKVQHKLSWEENRPKSTYEGN